MGTIRDILYKLWKRFVQIIYRGLQMRCTRSATGKTSTNNSTGDSLSKINPSTTITKVKIKQIKQHEKNEIL